jgi:hypothetical protein
MTIHKSALAPATSFLIATLCSQAVLAGTVTYKGHPLTSDSRVINGKIYVPLADVAKALSCKIVTVNGISDIQPASTPTSSAVVAGGANQVNATKGGVGDWLFDGRWRFKVNKVSVVSSFDYKYGDNAETETPNGANDLLVVVECSIKNGHTISDEPILTAHGLNTQATALDDDQGQSYPPAGFDNRNGQLAPGAMRNFAVIYSVPKGTNIAAMTFTLYGYSTSDSVSNVRIDLTGTKVSN